MNNPSIYSITNTANGKKYIGGASYPSQRFYEHKSALRLGTHRNEQLQKDWNVYGENVFLFEIIEETEKSFLSEREDFYIKICDNKYNVLSGFIGRQNGNSEAKSSTERGQTRTAKDNAWAEMVSKGKYKTLRKLMTAIHAGEYTLIPR